MSQLVDTLEQLVNTPSVTGDEGRICTNIAKRMAATWGLDAVRRIGNSLVVGSQTGRPLISLYGHLDTVPSQGNGEARIDGGRMYGLGTTDMKAGVAVMMHLLEAASVRSGPFDIVGVFYDKEEGPAAENGLEDVLDEASWLEQSALAIVMEPTDLKLELGCNGSLHADVVFTGHAAHSARPWWGENAITKAGAWLATMHDREPTNVEVAGLEYREVFSITRADGGIARNVIPSEFVVNLNHRFPPLYSLAEAEERLRAVAAVADRVEITDRAPAGAIPERNEHFELLKDALEAPIDAKQGWTDVARLTSRGVAAVNYGPGDAAVAHQVGEYVELSQLGDAYAALQRYLAG